MKHSKLRLTLAILSSIILYAGIITLTVFTYTYHGQIWDYNVFWIPLIVSAFVFEAVCGLVLINTKTCSDELKAFWLFVILIFPIAGAIFWLFLGIRKQQGYGYGQSGQTTLLSHLFKAKKSIKIYTNSFFVSYDTIKALNYATWKDVKVDVILSIEPKKWKQNLIKFNINKFLDPKVNIYFTNKELEHNFIILDDTDVIFNDKNFNYKHMYTKTKIFVAENQNAYISLWNKDFIKTSLFGHKQDKPKWTIRLKYGLLNIFYPFY